MCVARVAWIVSHCPVGHTLVMVKKRNSALLIRLPGHQATSPTLKALLTLVFSACKVDTGLAILTASTPTHGSDNLHNLDLL